MGDWKNICKDKDTRPKEQSYVSWKDLPPIPICFPAHASDTGSWRTTRPVTDYEKCTKCGFCFLYCPEGTIHEGKDGYYHVEYDYCKGCGVCANECPVKCISMVLESDAQEEKMNE